MTDIERTLGENAYHRAEAALDKLLSSLSTEEGQEEAKKLVQEISSFEDGVTFEITFPEPRTFSTIEPDFSTLESKRESDIPEIKRLVLELVISCKRYLQRPMITDTLPSHMARREWFGRNFDLDIQKRYLPYHQSNKMRYNNIGGLQEKINYLQLLLSSKTGIPRIDEKIAAQGKPPRVEWDKKDEVLAVLNSFPNMEDYGDLDENLEEKLRRISQIDAFCDGYLTLFEKK